MTGRYASSTDVPADRSKAQIEQVLVRWRALLLAIRAKLEAVEVGLSTFEQEFLAHTVLPDGRTVVEWVEPQLQEAYARGVMPAALPMLALGVGDG